MCDAADGSHRRRLLPPVPGPWWLLRRQHAVLAVQDVAEYWDNVLEKSVDKPTARALVSNIDVHQAGCSGCCRRTPLPSLVHGCKRAALPTCLQILGLRTPAEGEAGPESGGEEVSPPPARRGPGGRRGRPPLYTFFASIKKQYPKHVTLVRVSAGHGGTGCEVVPCSHHLALHEAKVASHGPHPCGGAQPGLPSSPPPLPLQPPRSASSTRRSALTRFCWCSTRG